MSGSMLQTGGLAGMHTLAFQAGFVKGELAVLKALMHISDWATGENIDAEPDQIALYAGLSVRQTKLLLKSLQNVGAVEIVVPSRGGRGRTNIRRICLERLRQMAQDQGKLKKRRASSPSPPSPSPEPCSPPPKPCNRPPLKPCNALPKPCNPRPQTVHSLPKNSAVAAPNQLKTPIKTIPPTNRESTDSASGDRERRTREVEEECLTFGVSKAKAQSLADTASLAEVCAGIALVKRAGGKVHSPAGMLVTLIEDGTAAREAARAAVRTERRLTPELPAWRVRRVDVLFSALCQFRSAAEWPEVRGSIRAIRDVVPTNERIAAAGLLSDDDLRLVEKHPREMLDKLRDAAVQFSAQTLQNPSVSPMHSKVGGVGAPR